MSTEFFNDQWRIPSNENQNKISNYSMEFDGTNGVVDTGESILHTTSSTVFSVSAWINVNDVSTDMNNSLGVISADAPAGNPTSGGFWLAYDDRNTANSPIQGIAYNIKTSTGFQRGKSNNNVISSNTWAHIVLVLDGQATLYINGVNSTNRTEDSQGTLVTQSNELTIGSFDNSSFDFKGKIDQTTIFDYALSQDQVTQLGAEGYAFNFIPNDKINVGNNSNLNITGALTVSIWMKTTSTAIQGLISKVGSATTRSFGLYIYYSNGISVVQSYVSTDGSAIALTGKGLNAASSVHDGNWHHILMVNDPTTTNNYLYVDGVEVKTTTNGRPLFSSTVDTNIGFLDPSYRFNGELSNAQIFNSVIPPTGSNSVQTIYNNGKPLSDMSGFTSLKGWWKLDENAIFNTTSTEWSVDNNALPST